MLILFGPALRGAGGAMDGSHCSGERVPFEAFGVLRKAQWHFDDASVQSVVRGWLGWPGHTRVASTPARASNLDLVRIDLEVAPPRLSRLFISLLGSPPLILRSRLNPRGYQVPCGKLSKPRGRSAFVLAPTGSRK